jgi:peptide-methionine (S)-S-oxide reductase
MTASRAQEQGLEIATFAGGCFWCMEPPYDKLEGVHKTIVGYTGGTKKNPTYQEVSNGTTGHAEAVEVHYDPKVISYEKLVDTFWRNINPITIDKQFADEGSQYRTAIFYHNEEQKRIAEASKKEIEDSGKYKEPIVTQIVPASVFYPAEEYHQDYYIKNGVHYQMYRIGSGREGYLKKMWGEKK